MYEELSRLIAPVATSDFFECFEQRKHLHVSRYPSDCYLEILTVSSIDAFLRSQQLPTAFVRLVTDGFFHPVEDWSTHRRIGGQSVQVALSHKIYEFYARGATVILNGAHDHMPSLSTLCSRLMKEFGVATQANIYITPPGCRGFQQHVDKHEVLILQISGRKSWLLFPANAAPVQIELREGDLLYIPAGLAHGATAADKASIHVTVGLFPAYGFQLIEELARVARELPEFWRPFLPADAGVGNSEHHAGFERQLLDLITATPVKTLVGRYSDSLVNSQPQNWSGRLQDLLLLPRLTEDTVVCMRPEILNIVQRDGAMLQVRFATHRITVPLFLKASLDRVLHNQPFAIRDLPGLVAGVGKVSFVKPFLETGFLTIVDV